MSAYGRKKALFLGNDDELCIIDSFIASILHTASRMPDSSFVILPRLRKWYGLYGILAGISQGTVK